MITKEQQQPNEKFVVKSMTGSEVEEVESIEVASDAVHEERQNSLGEALYKIDEPKPVTAQFETPRRPAPRLVENFVKNLIKFFWSSSVSEFFVSELFKRTVKMKKRVYKNTLNRSSFTGEDIKQFFNKS